MIKASVDLIVGGEYTYFYPNSDLYISTGILESADLTSDEIELKFKYRPNLFWRGTRARFEKYWTKMPRAKNEV